MAIAKELNAESTKGYSDGFSPRVYPRPEYPSTFEGMKMIVEEYTRAPLILTALTYLVYPIYIQLLDWLKMQGITEEATQWALLAAMTHSALYFTMNTAFYICDRYKLMQKYKLYRSPVQQPSGELLKDTLKEAIINQFLLGPVTAYFAYFAFKELIGIPSMCAALSSNWVDVYKGFVIAKMFNDVFFYLAHRLFHHKKIYKYFHKQHHKYIGTIGFAAEYANPLEQVLANQGPTILGSLLFARHPLEFFLWIAYRLEETYEGHSGYAFYGTFLHQIGLTHSSNAIFHDHHHGTNQGNFGARHMDWLFGTMDHFLAAGGDIGYLDRKKQENKQN